MRPMYMAELRVCCLLSQFGMAGAALIHRHPIVLTPPLNRLEGIDFGPICFEYQVHLIIASGTAAAVSDIDDALPRVGRQYARADILAMGRPRKQ